MRGWSGPNSASAATSAEYILGLGHVAERPLAGAGSRRPRRGGEQRGGSLEVIVAEELTGRLDHVRTTRVDRRQISTHRAQLPIELQAHHPSARAVDRVALRTEQQRGECWPGGRIPPGPELEVERALVVVVPRTVSRCDAGQGGQRLTAPVFGLALVAVHVGDPPKRDRGRDRGDVLVATRLRELERLDAETERKLQFAIAVGFVGELESSRGLTIARWSLVSLHHRSIGSELGQWGAMVEPVAERGEQDDRSRGDPPPSVAARG